MNRWKTDTTAAWYIHITMGQCMYSLDIFSPLNSLALAFMVKDVFHCINGVIYENNDITLRTNLFSLKTGKISFRNFLYRL